MNINRIFHWSLMAFLVIGTFFYCFVPNEYLQRPDLTIEYVMNTQEFFIRFAVMWLFSISLFLKSIRTFRAKETAFFLAYVVGISTFISFDQNQRHAILNLFIYAVFLKMIIEHFDFKYLKNIVWTLFGILVLNLLFCIAQRFNHDPLFYYPANVAGFSQPVGMMRLEAHLGVLTALISPFLFIISPWLVLVSFPLLFWGKASAAIVAFLVTSLFLIFFKIKRKHFYLLVVGLIAVSCFYIYKFDMPGGNFGRRFEVWNMTLKEVLRHTPYFGFGLGKFAEWAPQTKQLTTEMPLTWLWAHNEYLQTFFETGTVGMIILIFYFKKQIKNFMDLKMGSYELKCLFASFVSVSLISIIHFPFHIARLAGISMFILAIYQAKVIEEEKSQWTVKDLEESVTQSVLASD